MLSVENYAYQIKVTLNSIFKLGKYKMGEIIDLDFIEKQPFIPISLILGNFYNGADPSFKIKINDFYGKYHSEMGKSIEEIGEEKIEYILEDFKRIVSKI